MFLLLIMMNWSVRHKLSVLMSGWNTPLQLFCVIRSVCCVSLLPPWWCSNWLQPAAAHTHTHTPSAPIEHGGQSRCCVVVVLELQAAGRWPLLLFPPVITLSVSQLLPALNEQRAAGVQRQWADFTSALCSFSSVCVQPADQHHWLWLNHFHSCLWSELCLVQRPVTWVLLFRRWTQWRVSEVKSDILVSRRGSQFILRAQNWFSFIQMLLLELFFCSLRTLIVEGVNSALKESDWSRAQSSRQSEGCVCTVCVLSCVVLLCFVCMCYMCVCDSWSGCMQRYSDVFVSSVCVCLIWVCSCERTRPQQHPAALQWTPRIIKSQRSDWKLF